MKKKSKKNSAPSAPINYNALTYESLTGAPMVQIEYLMVHQEHLMVHLRHLMGHLGTSE